MARAPRLYLRKAARADIAGIERAPERFPPALDDIRKALLPRFPYVVYFVIHSRGLSVLAVMHGRRDPRRWQSRR